jgi:hypothetical protein
MMCPRARTVDQALMSYQIMSVQTARLLTLCATLATMILLAIKVYAKGKKTVVLDLF